MNIKKTHRCEKSIKEGVSIRFCDPFDIIIQEEPSWWLLRHEHDFDYNSHYLRPLSKIGFCPYCGKKLEEEAR